MIVYKIKGIPENSLFRPASQPTKRQTAKTQAFTVRATNKNMLLHKLQLYQTQGK
jgi:hypothetical protein